MTKRFRDESHICVVFITDDLDLSGSIHAGPDQCDQRIPCPDQGGYCAPSSRYCCAALWVAWIRVGATAAAPDRCER